MIPVQLDITSAADVAAAADRRRDVTLLINNAGISTRTPALSEGALDAGRREMETNFFGTLAMSQAFAPILASNGGGALVNVLSVLSWVTLPTSTMYCASKAASWSLTNGLRVELAKQGTLVVGVHCGYIDTDMTARVEGPKAAAEVIAAEDTPYGRLATAADPTGAAFKLISPNTGAPAGDSSN